MRGIPRHSVCGQLGWGLLVWGSSRAWHTAAVATEAGPLLVGALAPRRHVVQVGPHLVRFDAVRAQLLADEIRLRCRMHRAGMHTVAG